MNPQAPQEQQPSPMAQPQMPPQFQQPNPPVPIPQHETPKHKKLILVGVFGLLVGVVATSVVLGVLNSKDTDTPPPSVVESLTGTQVKARDTERETDIKAMHGQIEAFWAQQGYYPSLKDMNDSTFRSTYLKGLDTGALKDPVGTDSILVATPTENAYSYEVEPEDCSSAQKDCQSYTLTATLEGGGTYYKYSLN